MAEISLFFSHSFAPNKVNPSGMVCDHGISDKELAERVVVWIKKYGKGRIKVITSHDPLVEYISHDVHKKLCAADVILCLFTQRTQDQITGKWLTSSYVLTESAVAYSQYATDQERLLRLHGLAEAGVDRSQLGIAFHNTDRVLPIFHRDSLEELEQKVRNLVENLVAPSKLARNDREYLSIEKEVFVRRTGFVQVETRHRFRFTKPISGEINIPHRIWRISKELPPVEELAWSNEDNPQSFLWVTPLDSGHPNQRVAKFAIAPVKNGHNDHRFDVNISQLNLEPGNELHYSIGSGYPNAFEESPPEGCLNTVGLRSSGRGTAHQASLTINFEHDGKQRPQLLRGPISVWQSREANVSETETISEFWHNPENWNEIDTLKPCPHLSGVFREVYRWSTDTFEGTIKTQFIPHKGYFPSPIDEEQPRANESRRRANGAGK